MNPLYILFAIPFFFLLMGVEYLYSRIKGKVYYRLNDTISNLLIGIGNQAFNLIFKAALMAAYVWIFQNWSFFQLPPTWWSFVLCLIGFDFLFYWAHRWGHEVNLFWAAHLVHHSSEEYNLSVALRQSWFHNALAFFIFLPLPLLGFDPYIFVAAAGIDTIYQFWIHTKAIGKLPAWIEFWLNTPSHHRVHHGRNPKYIDKNYAGVLILWDRMFGTFQEEEEEVVYGITSPLRSWNPAWANIHYFVELFQLASRIRGWWHRFVLLFMPPGWKPKALGGQASIPDLKDQDLKIYETNCSKPMRAYALVQFLSILLGLLAYMINFGNLTWHFQIAFLAIIVVSGMICTAILENKTWVIIAEYLRLVFVIACLNTLYILQYADWIWVMLIGSGIAFVGMNIWFTLGWTLPKRQMVA